jgi:hypothetical protein
MVAPTWITPGCVQFLENKKRFHTAWVKRVILIVRRSLPVFPDKRTFSESDGMSQRCHIRTHAPQQSVLYSITSSVRASSIGERSTPECLRSLEIDDQLKFVRKFDRQVTRLGTFEDLHDVGSRATKVISEIDAIAD